MPFPVMSSAGSAGLGISALLVANAVSPLANWNERSPRAGKISSDNRRPAVENDQIVCGFVMFPCSGERAVKQASWAYRGQALDSSKAAPYKRAQISNG